MDRRGFVRASPALGLAWLLAGCSSGKQIGLGIHPWIGYETLYLARDFGWLPSSVTLIEGATALDSLGALRAGRAAAACLTLDEVLRARAEGVPLAVLPDRARGAKSDLRNLIDAHFKGLEHLRLYRQDAIHRIAGRQNMGVDEVTRALAGVALPTLAANRSLLSSSNPRLTKSAARVGRWMVDAKLVDHFPDSPALFSTEWLPRHA